MTIARSVLALLVLTVAYPASAQTDQGRLTGIVTDTSAGILPGVTVTALSRPRSSACRPGRLETDGRYRFPSLSPGRYTLTFELGATLQTTRRENIVLGLGQTLNADIQLAVATLQETVTVTAESPVVDVSSTKIGSEFGAEVAGRDSVGHRPLGHAGPGGRPHARFRRGRQPQEPPAVGLRELRRP
ncbi:MAG: carboxypeptidase-like regulatory domain-containing protein [Vicinamibacterales bacterium]